MAGDTTSRVEPPRFSLSGVQRAWAALPALAMVALSFVPAVAERAVAARHTQVVAAVLVFVVLLAASHRTPLHIDVTLRRPHYMQAVSQLGVFVWWGAHWAPVASFAWMIAIQLLVAYQVDLLICWLQGRRWQLGLGQLPIVGSINLFLWFRDEQFIWQLGVVALCYLGKTWLRWQRDGRSRHIFNPSSFGLGVASALLLLTGSSGLTFAREIATTQEATPHIWQALFALGLIVQLQFPVVLVTMAAAVTTWLLSVGYTAATGVYMFATTDLPAAVLLGMLLLVTDPATSPSSRSGKLLFGAGYGVLVLVLFPPLEALGSYGYFDKLLPVPLLNLGVRRIDGWCRGIDERVARWWRRRPGFELGARNVAHVGGWCLVFVGLWIGDAVGQEHPGRDIAFWRIACADDRRGACETHLDLLTTVCLEGEPKACHNLAVELAERQRRGVALTGKKPRYWYRLACDAGLQQSCAALAPPKPAPAVAAQLHRRACELGEAIACARLADAYERGEGVVADATEASRLRQLACRSGHTPACAE